MRHRYIHFTQWISLSLFLPTKSGLVIQLPNTKTFLRAQWAYTRPIILLQCNHYVSYHNPRNLQYSNPPRLRALNRTSTYNCHRPLHPRTYRCALHHTAVCKLRSREPLTLNACIIKPSSWLLQLDLRDGRIRQSARDATGRPSHVRR